jgi:hypothetical protein
VTEFCYNRTFLFWGTMLRAGRSWVRDPVRWMIFFSIFLIPPGALGLGVHSAPKRNEYQKQKNNSSWGIEPGRRVGLKTLPPSVSQLSRQCWILDISQSYKLQQAWYKDSFFLLIGSQVLRDNHSGCLTMDILYAFKCKPSRNTRHAVTLEYHCKAFWNILYIIFQKTKHLLTVAAQESRCTRRHSDPSPRLRRSEVENNIF